MKQKISKRKVFELSVVISGAICLFAILVIAITLQHLNLSNKIAETANAYFEPGYIALNATDSYSDCTVDLGGTWTLATKTCEVTSSVTLTNTTLLISGGATLNSNGNVTIQFTTGTIDDANQAALVLIGAPPGHTPATSTADDLIINLAGHLDYGVILEGNGTALSNTTISNSTKADILVSRNASNFDIQSNTTSGGPVGVEVKHWASTGTIDDHTATSQTSHGIEIYGADNVDVTNSDLTGNGGSGLYIHDAIWTVEYSPIFDQVGTGIDSTYGFVDGNTITGNTSHDVTVNVTDANAWDAAQSTASNTYVTLNEINGTFPGTKLGLLPAGQYSVDTFDLTVEVNGYQAVTEDCTPLTELDLQNPNEVSGNLRAQAGDFYGVHACEIEIIHNDPTTNFQVAVDKFQPGDLTDGTNTFSDIANAGAIDCLVDTSGNTDEEEYGYRLENVSVVSGVDVQTDTECDVTYDSTGATPPNEYLFDIEYESGDIVLVSTGSSPSPICLSGDCTFDLEVAANISWNTFADTTYDSFSTSGDYEIVVSTTVLP